MSKSPGAAKHMFYYLLVLFTLGFTSIGLGQILFQVINASFPETVPYHDANFSEWILRFGLSSVIIASPVYWLVTHTINKELEKKILDADSAVRKWLTYLFLLLSSLTVIGFLVGTLNSFLGGEVTVKFILKSLSAILIAGLVFGYYFYDIRRDHFEVNQTIVLFRIIFAGIVVGSVILAFFFLESPSLLRARREDQERVNRLRNIVWPVEEYYREQWKLPRGLTDIEGKFFVGDQSDPVTKNSFEYRILNEKTYELCATFSLSNRERSPGSYEDPEYLHDAGRYCFEKKIMIDPSLPPVPIKRR